MSLQLGAGRIDVLLSGDPARARAGEWPFLPDPKDAITKFGKIAVRAVEAFRLRQGRLAFAAQLLLLQETSRDTWEALMAAVPGLPVKADDHEVIFRRGRHRASAREGVRINYIETWTATFLQMVRRADLNHRLRDNGSQPRPFPKLLIPAVRPHHPGHDQSFARVACSSAGRRLGPMAAAVRWTAEKKIARSRSGLAIA